MHGNSQWAEMATNRNNSYPKIEARSGVLYLVTYHTLTLPSPPHSAYIDHRRERRFVEQFQTISRTFPLPAIHCKTPNCAFALARSSPPQTQPTGLRITVEYCSTANRRILQTLLGHLQAPIFRLVSTLRGKHDPVPGATALKRFSHTRRPSHRSQSFSTLLPFHKA
ncbi:hypothetical protein IAQ61_001145 [Plenodomus lingam]|uniref:uncharacterized protein n=1 Tax=Leptosphaeria maculans TaxID=5022 RepID=UPI003326CC27|nr:hypothetical protein IAQ61_001145 [Plenodomus lingam]